MERTKKTPMTELMGWENGGSNRNRHVHQFINHTSKENSIMGTKSSPSTNRTGTGNRETEDTDHESNKHWNNQCEQRG